MLPGCDAFPIDPNVSVLVGLGSLTVLVSMTVGFCLMLLLYRLSDQTLRSYRARLLPAPGRVLVTAGRLLGWGLVATAAVAASVAAIALVAYALAERDPGLAGGAGAGGRGRLRRASVTWPSGTCGFSWRWRA